VSARLFFIAFDAAKIPLVAMPRRDQWNFFSVGRSRKSVGRSREPCGTSSHGSSQNF
jgi:hypothetical protein